MSENPIQSPVVQEVVKDAGLILQNPVSSKVFWGGVISLALLVGGSLGLWQKLGITSQFASDALNGLFAIGSLVAIRNNPSLKDKF